MKNQTMTFAIAFAAAVLGTNVSQAQNVQHAIVNGQNIQPRPGDVPPDGVVTDPAAGVKVDPKSNSFVPLKSGKLPPLPEATDFYGKPFGNPDAENPQPVDSTGIAKMNHHSAPPATSQLQ
jgi:hypothetical protein